MAFARQFRANNAARLATVDVYRVDAVHPSPFAAGHDAFTKNNAYAYPPMSATLLVFRAPRRVARAALRL